MRRSDIVTQIRNISLVTSQDDLIKMAIQVALDRFVAHFDWPYFLQPGFIYTTAPISTGTVDVINGNKTITGQSTSWDNSLIGRKFRIQGANTYYHIISVDIGAQTLTLLEPFSGPTVNGQTYSIYKDEYRLPSDLNKQKSAQQLFNSIYMRDMTPGEFDQNFPAPINYSDPIYQILSGTRLDTYSTGTVTISGSTITGIGTAWSSLEGFGRMSNITIGTGVNTQVLTVKSVDSDTSLTVYEIPVAVSVGVSYFITLNNLVLQLYQIPDSARIIAFRYYRQPQFLANDWDIPDMPHEWHWLLIYGALSFVYLQKGADAVTRAEVESKFTTGLDQMKLKIGSFVSNRVMKRRSLDRPARITTDGLERAQFDRRYSS